MTPQLSTSTSASASASISAFPSALKSELPIFISRPAWASLSLVAALALSACGGGGGNDTADVTVSPSVDAVELLARVPGEAVPVFHMAPVDISDPSLVPGDADVIRT
ncbi:MAG: hypothetical protein JWQ88_1807, partial [Rhodoferax sp.]|nr:hypothetical protein [Rhodoferax sp.]